MLKRLSKAFMHAYTFLMLLIQLTQNTWNTSKTMISFNNLIVVTDILYGEREFIFKLF